MRPVIAWIAACVAAVLSLSVILAIGGSGSWLSVNAMLMLLVFVGPFVVAFTAPAWPVLVLTARGAGWPRGWVDVLLGAIMGGGELFLFSGGDASVVVVGVFAAAGAVGGLTYWLAAGRPRSTSDRAAQGST